MVRARVSLLPPAPEPTSNSTALSSRHDCACAAAEASMIATPAVFANAPTHASRLRHGVTLPSRFSTPHLLGYCPSLALYSHASICTLGLYIALDFSYVRSQCYRAAPEPARLSRRGHEGPDAYSSSSSCCGGTRRLGRVRTSARQTGRLPGQAGQDHRAVSCRRGGRLRRAHRRAKTLRAHRPAVRD